MTETENTLKQVDALLAKGDTVLRTHQSHPPNFIGFPTLEPGAFAEWREQSIAFLHRILGPEHQYATSFAKNVARGFQSNVMVGQGILRAFHEDLEAGRMSAPMQIDALATVTLLCVRFHVVASQLRVRREGRPTLDVVDELRRAGPIACSAATSLR